jgi:vacuolar-type H+-ATPase subunit I/STV1
VFVQKDKELLRKIDELLKGCTNPNVATVQGRAVEEIDRLEKELEKSIEERRQLRKALAKLIDAAAEAIMVQDVHNGSTVSYVIDEARKVL